MPPKRAADRRGLEAAILAEILDGVTSAKAAEQRYDFLGYRTFIKRRPALGRDGFQCLRQSGIGEAVPGPRRCPFGEELLAGRPMLLDAGAIARPIQRDSAGYPEAVFCEGNGRRQQLRQCQLAKFRDSWHQASIAPGMVTA